MQFIQAIILGIVQGLTEFIPVSSSGHLIVAGNLLQFDASSLGFDLALHVGTLAALVIIFGRDFWDIARGVLGRDKASTKLFWLLVVATVPGVILGVMLQSAAETVFRSNLLVAINLIAVALLMLAADYFAKLKLSIAELTPGKAFGIGLAQSLALFPGVSRSGSTITAGLFLGLDRVAATRFSFMLSAPIIAGAIAKVLISEEGRSLMSGELSLMLVGALSAFVSGYWAIKFLLRYLSKHGLKVFAYYRIGLGVVVLITMARW